MATEWNRRFFDSTRGLVVLLLRKGEQTVNDLATQLELTDNAVRAHLAALERDGLVERAGLRRGAGKPSYAYRLTEGAAFLFPQAYDAIVVQLLETLSDRLGPEQSLDLLRATGRRLAQAQPPATGDLQDRVEQAAELVTALGGSVEVATLDDGYEIRGFSCPFAEAVNANSDFCCLVQELLAEFTEAGVVERCDREGPPRCCFQITLNGNGHRPPM